MLKCLLAISLILAAPVFGAPLDDATKRWLAGDDAASLPELASMAASGDEAAQLLLGQIDRDTTPGATSEYLLGISRAERADLLRSPVVRRGSRNWLLAIESERTPLAIAMFEYRFNDRDILDAMDLHDLGERAKAEHMLWSLLNQGKFDQMQRLPEDNDGLYGASTLNWLRGYFSAEHKPQRVVELVRAADPEQLPGVLLISRLGRILGSQTAISPELQEFALVLNGQSAARTERMSIHTYASHLWKLAESDPALKLVRDVCVDICGNSQSEMCIPAVLQVIEGYSTLFSLRTPVENVISQTEFMSSAQARMQLRQMIRIKSGYRGTQIAPQCLLPELR